MPDREKVNRGLHQHCECSLFDRCGECPYYEFSDEQFSCRDRLLEDVLFLLKEQEVAYQGAVELLRQKTILFDDAIKRLKEQESVKPRVSTAEQRCGHCNKVIEMDGWKACPWCGKMIDWERWWNENGTHDNP